MSGDELERLQKDNAEMVDDWLRKRPEKNQWARQNHGTAPFRADAETMQRFDGDAGLLQRACDAWRVEAKTRHVWWEFNMPVAHFAALSQSLTAYADRNRIYCDHAIVNFAERSTRLIIFGEPPEAGGSQEAGYEMYSLHKAAVETLRRIEAVLCQPATEFPPVDDGERLDERALAVFVVHRDWTKKQIAEWLDCHEKSLTPKRCPQLNIAIQAYRAAELPKGSKSADGTIEAWD